MNHAAACLIFASSLSPKFYLSHSSQFVKNVNQFMSLLHLISSNGFHVQSVKSNHLTSQSEPVHILPSLSMLIRSGHRSVCHFQTGYALPVLGPSPSCPSAWNAQPWSFAGMVLSSPLGLCYISSFLGHRI